MNNEIISRLNIQERVNGIDIPIKCVAKFTVPETIPE